MMLSKYRLRRLSPLGRMVSMYDPDAIRAMIDRNRADLAAYDDQLAKVASRVLHVDQNERCKLQWLAREMKRARWRSRLLGWLLSPLHPFFSA
jgi:hypothetical protein